MHYRPAGSGTTSIAETTAGCVGHALTAYLSNRRAADRTDGSYGARPEFGAEPAVRLQTATSTNVPGRVRPTAARVSSTRSRMRGQRRTNQNGCLQVKTCRGKAVTSLLQRVGLDTRDMTFATRAGQLSAHPDHPPLVPPAIHLPIVRQAHRCDAEMWRSRDRRNGLAV